MASMRTFNKVISMNCRRIVPQTPRPQSLESTRPPLPDDNNKHENISNTTITIHFSRSTG